MMKISGFLKVINLLNILLIYNHLIFAAIMITRSFILSNETNQFKNSYQNQRMKLKVSPSNPELTMSHITSKSKKICDDIRIPSENDLSEDVYNKIDNSSIQIEKLLMIYAEENKKLVKQRMALFQKNCQLINEIKTISVSKSYLYSSSTPTQKKTNDTRYRLNWNRNKADEKQFCAQKNPQFRVSLNPGGRQQDKGSSPVSIFLKTKAKAGQLSSSKFFIPDQRVDFTINVRQKKQTKIKSPIQEKYQNEQTIRSIYNPLTQANNKNNKRITISKAVKNQSDNKNQNQDCLNNQKKNKTMKTKLQTISSKKNGNQSALKINSPINVFDNLDAKIKKLKDQNKKLKTQYFL